MNLKLSASARLFLGLTGSILFLASYAAAQSVAQESAEAPPALNLAASQEAIEMRYRRFEATLQQLSEYLRKTDPSRAELLVRAIGKSKEVRIPDQLGHLTDLLKKDLLGDAVERQELVVVELQSLLELLMSEARMDDLDREKKRIQELIKDVNKLISKETDARADTERGGNNGELQNQQKQVAESTQNLVQKIKAQDASKKQGKSDEKEADRDANKPESKNESDEKDSETPLSDKKDNQPPSNNEQGRPSDPDSNKKPSDEKKANGQDQTEQNGDKKSEKSDSDKGESKKPGESKKGEPQTSKPPKAKPSDSKPQNGKPNKGKPQEGPQEEQPPQEGQKQNDQQDQQDESPDDEQAPKKQPDKTAGRDELERAKREMDRAIEELKKNNRKNASDKQDKAIAELMKAKERLEEILRQLREEEKELVLAQMEARFRDMLLKQEAVNNATLAIHAVDVEHRTDRHRNRAVELARNEEEIVLLASKALTLLKEEGSSIAFPEAVEQIRDDMQTIARRLERVDVGEITQNIEQDTLEGLKEILEALQKELEKAKDKKQQSQQQKQEQQQQQKSLVNKLAEMKMLRSLQFRVNRRTRQLGRLLEGEQAVDPDIINQLKQLSDRQAKVQKTTYDLATGKNQ